MLVRFDENTQVARLLAYVTGMVNQQFLVQNEYLICEKQNPPGTPAGATPTH